MYKYKAIKINGKKYDEHRYIMEQLLGRKLNYNECVHHIDGNGRNNELYNLELIDRSIHSINHRTGSKALESTIDKLRIKGRMESLEKTKFSKELILEIKNDLNNGVKNVNICRKYNVNKYLVSKIKHGKRWEWLN